MLDKYDAFASLTLQHDQVRRRDCVEFGLLAVVRPYNADHWLNSPSPEYEGPPSESPPCLLPMHNLTGCWRNVVSERHRHPESYPSEI
jgi:hypothetical protein